MSAGKRKALLIVGVAVLAIAALALSVFALSQNSGEQSPAADYTFTPEPTETSKPEPTPEAEPSPQPETAEVVAPKRLLAIGPEGHLVRGEIGSCPEPTGWAEVSLDDGETWTPARTEVFGATQLLSIGVGDALYTQMMTRDEACDLFPLRSYVGGTTWEDGPGLLENDWHFDPQNPEVVFNGVNEIATPCDAVQVAGDSGIEAALLCSDSTVVQTVNGGESWSLPISVQNAAAITTFDGAVLVSTTESEGCQGVQIQQIFEKNVTPLGTCFETGTSDGDIAMFVTESEIALWVENSFVRSFDAGESWL